MQFCERFLNQVSAALDFDERLEVTEGHFGLLVQGEYEVHHTLDPEEHTLLQTSVIGEFNYQFPDEILAGVVAANHPERQVKGFTIGGIADIGFFALSRQYDLAGLSGDRFVESLDDCVTAVRSWRGWLDEAVSNENITPPCAAAACAESESGGGHGQSVLEQLRTALLAAGFDFTPHTPDCCTTEWCGHTIELQSLPQGAAVWTELPPAASTSTRYDGYSELLRDNLWFSGSSGSTLWIDEPGQRRCLGRLFPFACEDGGDLEAPLLRLLHDFKTCHDGCHHHAELPRMPISYV